MKRYLNLIRILIITLVCVIALPGFSFGAEESTDEDIQAETQTVLITVPFPNFSETIAYEWDFPYNDDYFSKPSDVFSTDLAKATIGLTVSAFRNNKGLMDNQYATYLEGAGFSDIHAFGYDQETSKDTLSGVIAHKKMDGFTLIAAVPCGQGYRKEWAGNLEVGDEERHVGFNHAAGIMEEQIWSYIESHHLEGPMKLWLGGFSRASAVANLTAADMIDSGQFEDVYAYLFAVPRTTKSIEPYKYSGIYNICGKYDPVTQIPAEAWGFERYGTDIYTPAMEMDSHFIDLAVQTSEICQKLIDDDYWYNPEVNYQLHLIIEFLSELFPTNAEYAEKLQDSLMEVWGEANPETFLMIISEAVDQLDDLDQRQEYSSEVFIEYLEYLIASQIAEDRKQVDRGFWNQNQGIVDNIMREHMPYTYIDWVFSDNPERSLYYGPDIARRVYIYGDVDVEIWQNGKVLQAVNRKGEESFPGLVDDEGEWAGLILLIRNGEETLASLPCEEDYQIHIKTHKDENLLIYDIFSMPFRTYGYMDNLNELGVSKGEYILEFYGLIDDFTIKEIEGEIQENLTIPFVYSPTLVMAAESGSTNHITIPGLLILIMYVLLFVAVLLFICLVIAIIHKIRKKKRGRPYSPWFVIVPHLIMIVLFTALTCFFTMKMYSIGITRVICAAVTMAALCLLSLRGLIRNHSMYNVLVTAGLVGVSVLNILVYQKSSLVSSSLWVFGIYCVFIIGLCILAVSTFFVRKALKTQTA